MADGGAGAAGAELPTRVVRFIVPFGPGAGADIGARLFAEKLQVKWRQPVVIENKPGGDGIVAIQAFLGANDEHGRRSAFRRLRRASVHVHQITVQPGRPDPDRACVQHHTRRGREEGCAVQQHKGIYRGCSRGPNIDSGLVQGITELTFWGYQHHEKLQITQVPYRDVNLAPVELVRRPHPGVATSASCGGAAAVARRPHQADRRDPTKPSCQGRPRGPDGAGEGYPSLEIEGMAGCSAQVNVRANQGKNRRRRARSHRRWQHQRAASTRTRPDRQYWRAEEFASSIAEQSANVAAVVKVIDFKPKN